MATSFAECIWVKRLTSLVESQGSESGFLTDFRVARELTRESGGSVPLGDMSLPRIWLEGLDLIGAWS